MKYILKNSLEAINNVIGINDNNFEVIISDDGSTDGTEEYIKGLNRNYKLVYVYTKRDNFSCRNRARNLGYKKATGNIIVFLDGDIIVKENLLNELKRCYNMTRNCIIVGARIMLDKDIDCKDVYTKKVYQMYKFDKNKIEQLDNRYLKYDILSFNSQSMNHSWLMAHTCLVSMPKQALNDVGGFDESIKGWGFDESELMYRLHKYGLNIIINNRLEVLHQKHTEFRKTLDDYQVLEFSNNIKYFFEKHKEALDILPYNLDEYFMKDNMLELFTIDRRFNKYKLFKLINNTDYETLKTYIDFNKDNINLQINVYDYLEDSNIDIWIQLLENVKCLIKYYPISKCISEKNHSIMKEINLMKG